MLVDLVFEQADLSVQRSDVLFLLFVDLNEGLHLSLVVLNFLVEGQLLVFDLEGLVMIILELLLIFKVQIFALELDLSRDNFLLFEIDLFYVQMLLSESLSVL